jgi:hypothetical protein
VCCTTIESCASIGVSADRVDEFSTCEDGQVCRGTTCVEPPSSDAPLPDGPSPRCDPHAEFETYELVPGDGLNDPEQPVVRLSLSEDELVAYVDVDLDAGEVVMRASVRESLLDEFPTPVEAAELDDIYEGPGRETNGWTTSNGLALYFQRNGAPFVSTRLATGQAFDEGNPVTVGGAALSSFVQLSADGQTIYWRHTDNRLWSAALLSGLTGFGQGVDTSVDVEMIGRVSADELTLYYVLSGAMRRAIRSQTGFPFQGGVVIAGFPAAVSPLFVTADHCLLYYRGADERLYVARRGS